MAELNMYGLKPCPFCGGKELNVRKGKFMWWVECCNADCGASSGAKSKKVAAIETWNRRADNADLHLSD